MDRICNQYSIREELEIVDQNILFALNKARKFIEGPYQNIPFSKEKEKRRVALLYWDIRKKEVRERTINHKTMMIRLKIVEIYVIGYKIREEVDAAYIKASEDWKELCKKGKQIREEELLD